MTDAPGPVTGLVRRGPDVCRRRTLAADLVGRPCPDCGHTDYLHPGNYNNPHLDACVICALLVVHDDMVELRDFARGHRGGNDA